MPTPPLVPPDGDPPEDPAAAELAAAARGAEAGDADTQRTEDPLPESSPSGRDAASDT